MNHASIIDGIRLCKARRLRFANGDMDELEARLEESADARHRLIATDGVFSMDGYFAQLPEICDLAERHDAIVMVDDSHAVGFVGAERPRHPRAARRDRPRRHHHRHARQGDGRCQRGIVAARAEVVELLRQRSRPYLFSNSLAPPIAAAEPARARADRGLGRAAHRLAENTARFRTRMSELDSRSCRAPTRSCP